MSCGYCLIIYYEPRVLLPQTPPPLPQKAISLLAYVCCFQIRHPYNYVMLILLLLFFFRLLIQDYQLLLSYQASHMYLMTSLMKVPLFLHLFLW